MIKACKKCRRENEKLMLKGERCASPSCAMVKRPYAPGQHGQGFRGKQSEYGKQLREKQKTRRIYGIAEAQFARMVEMSEKQTGNTTENLMRILESRVDNVVYRLGFAPSRSCARQFVTHGLFSVNGQKVSVPSMLLKDGDIVAPIKKESFKEINNINTPAWLELDSKKVEGKVKHLPIRDEIDTTVNESLVIEFYSR